MRSWLLVLLLACPVWAQDYLTAAEHQVRLLRSVNTSIGEHMRAWADDLNNLSPDVPAYREYSGQLTTQTEELVKEIEANQAPPDAQELQEALVQAAERAQRCAVHVRATLREIEELNFLLRRPQGIVPQQLAPTQEALGYLKARKKALDASVEPLRGLLDSYKLAHPRPSPSP